MNKLLIIEDDRRLREIITDYFSAKDFSVTEISDGSQALERLNDSDYDIVLLDIMMPHIDGFTVCRAIRRKSSVPVIFLTARSTEDDVLIGYESGADDYIIKPCSLKVLYAKVTALINRSKNLNDRTYKFNGLSVNIQKHTVTIDGELIALAPKEYDLLLYLIENKGIVLSRQKILNAVWGYDYFGEERAVDTHIKILRKALREYSGHIQTVIKKGYRFNAGNQP